MSTTEHAFVGDLKSPSRQGTVRSGSRTTPNDLDAERALVGAMLISAPAASVGIEICSAADFYSPASVISSVPSRRSLDATTVSMPSPWLTS